jgi:hypothetical protein
MKPYVRDGFSLILVIAMGLAWWNDDWQRRKALEQVTRRAESMQKLVERSDRHLALANSEADGLSEEIRRLRGIVKLSLADKRTWFEIEVKGKKLIAIYPATSQSDGLTLETVERIESATGLEAQRLRHFLTPISASQLGQD